MSSSRRCASLACNSRISLSDTPARSNPWTTHAGIDGPVGAGDSCVSRATGSPVLSASQNWSSLSRPNCCLQMRCQRPGSPICWSLCDARVRRTVPSASTLRYRQWSPVPPRVRLGFSQPSISQNRRMSLDLGCGNWPGLSEQDRRQVPGRVRDKSLDYVRELLSPVRRTEIERSFVQILVEVVTHLVHEVVLCLVVARPLP